MNYIYILTNNEIPFYVGKTKNLKERLRKHKTESRLGRTHKENYIKKVIDDGGIISIYDIDISNDDNINNLEIYWISQLKSWGFKLLNSTDGGEGGDNWSGKNHSNHTIKKISDSMKKFYANNPDKIRRYKGEKNGRSKLTEDQVIEIKKLKSQGNSYKKISIKYSVSKTLIIDIIKGRRWSYIK